MNYFIAQFGNPTGGVGRFLSKIMNLSNKRMYKANMTRLDDGMKILEIGYGNGKQLEMIKKTYASTELYGIDISEDMYKSASNRLGKEARLSISEARDLPYEDSFFDAVITTDTFYFWNNPYQVMLEIHRVLKNRGIFINSFNSMYSNSVGKTRKDEVIYRSEDLVKMGKKCGLEVVSKQKLGLYEHQIVFKKMKKGDDILF